MAYRKSFRRSRGRGRYGRKRKVRRMRSYGASRGGIRL